MSDITKTKLSINSPPSFSMKNNFLSNNYHTIGSSYKSNNYLPEKLLVHKNKKTLVLDLDETLVHSSFKNFVLRADIVLRVEIDQKIQVVHVLKRPGVENFLEKMSKLFEIVIFTASLSSYANPLIDELDSRRCVSYRLFREHCTPSRGLFIKEMSRLGRDLKDVIILDVKNIYNNRTIHSHMHMTKTMGCQ